MNTEPSITLIVDGFPEQHPPGLNLAQLLQRRGDPPKAVVVEHNGTYVPSPALAATVLADGDRVEIILPAFGG